MGPMALLPLQRKACCRLFITLKNLLPSARFEPADLGSSGRHANHYITEDDFTDISHMSRSPLIFFMPITYDFILGIVTDVYNGLVTFPAVFIINIHLFST
jgi:hypothetical protein